MHPFRSQVAVIDVQDLEVAPLVFGEVFDAFQLVVAQEQVDQTLAELPAEQAEALPVDVVAVEIQLLEVFAHHTQTVEPLVGQFVPVQLQGFYGQIPGVGVCREYLPESLILQIVLPQIQRLQHRQIV